MYLERKMSNGVTSSEESSRADFYDQSQDTHNINLSHLLRVDRTELQHRRVMTICWIWPDNGPLSVDKSEEVTITRSAVAAVTP